jgi:hypothetical protein
LHFYRLLPWSDIMFFKEARVGMLKNDIDRIFTNVLN